MADGAGGIRLGPLRLPWRHHFASGTRLSLGIRPEALALPLGPDADGPALAARLTRAENLGAEWHLHVRLDLPGAPPAIVRLTAAELEAARAAGLLDDPLTLVLRARGVHLFGPDGARVAPRPAPLFAAD
ncbi:MAG: TOBE domain-containing protein [Elioraea sp.]|nr:TOBE domain-containing protein [Elioraea sp.]